MNRVSSYRSPEPNTCGFGAESLNKIVDREEKLKPFLFAVPSKRGPRRSAAGVLVVRPAPTSGAPRAYPRGGLSKPNWTIGRALKRESQIPDWQEMQKTKTVYKMVLRLTTWLLANNSMTQLETPAGVS